MTPQTIRQELALDASDIDRQLRRYPPNSELPTEVAEALEEYRDQASFLIEKLVEHATTSR